MHATHRPANFASGRHAASVGEGGTRPDMEGQCVVEPRGVCVLFLVAVGDDIRKSWPFSWPATFRKKCVASLLTRFKLGVAGHGRFGCGLTVGLSSHGLAGRREGQRALWLRFI